MQPPNEKFFSLCRYRRTPSGAPPFARRSSRHASVGRSSPNGRPPSLTAAVAQIGRHPSKRPHATQPAHTCPNLARPARHKPPPRPRGALPRPQRDRDRTRRLRRHPPGRAHPLTIPARRPGPIVHRDHPAKAGKPLDDLGATLARGKTRRDRAAVEAEIAIITADPWLRRAIDIRLTGETPARHRLRWTVNTAKRRALQERGVRQTDPQSPTTTTGPWPRS